MQNRIEISVIMCCYNSAEYVAEAIESILNQTFKYFELIIIDDCSTDNTRSICESYAREDPRIVIVSLPAGKNQGAASARNTGIARAKGDWIAILDSDDIAMPTRFEEQLKLAAQNEKLVLIGSNSCFIDKSGVLIKTYNYPTTDAELSRRLNLLKSFPPHSSMMYKRSAVLGLSGFNARFLRSEDWDLWLRLSERGELASVDKTLVKIRKHENNISNSGGGMLQEKFGLIANICHVLRTRNLPDPSTARDEKTWEQFVAWVEKTMVSDGYFGKREFWLNITGKFAGSSSKVIGLVIFLKNLLTSRYIFSLVNSRINGETSPRKYADKLSLQKGNYL